MVILLKIKRRDFFQRDSISILVSRTVKTWKFKLLYFEMKHVTGMETCTRISVLFIFNLVQIRIRKTSLFWLYNLMTSLWKPCIRTTARWHHLTTTTIMLHWVHQSCAKKGCFFNPQRDYYWDLNKKAKTKWILVVVVKPWKWSISID